MGRHRAPDDDESRDDEVTDYDALSPDIPEADEPASSALGFRVPDDWAEMHGMPPAATPPASRPPADPGDRFETDESDDADYTDQPDLTGADSITQAFPSVPRRASVRSHGGDWEGGEWTGSHRAIQTKRRGVSVGVIAAWVPMAGSCRVRSAVVGAAAAALVSWGSAVACMKSSWW